MANESRRTSALRFRQRDLFASDGDAVTGELAAASRVTGYRPYLKAPKLPAAVSWWPVSRVLHERLYRDRLEDYEVFRRCVLQLATPSSVVVDLGAGRGTDPAINLKGSVKRVIGVDVDEDLAQNPYLDEWHVYGGELMPFLADNSVDLVYARYVAEHVESPLAMLREVRRVLRKGGSLLMLTPNRRHYIPIAATILGRGLQKAVARARGLHVEDSFSTVYALNTPEDVRRQAEGAGFAEATVYSFENQPSYLTFHPLLFAAGAAYERTVNCSPALRRFRGSLLLHLVA